MSSGAGYRYGSCVEADACFIAPTVLEPDTLSQDLFKGEKVPQGGKLGSIVRRASRPK